MRDGVRLAVDLSLPRQTAPGARLPALLAMTRYWRAQQLRAPLNLFLGLPDPARDFFTAYGYALLRVDMRGTGASEGHQPHPWPASDLLDMFDLLEWIVQQPWSSGKVHAFGNSYQGTTAEMLGACGHPAVEAALVRFNEYDVYAHIAFPGGIPNEFILREWAAYNRALDANRLPARAGLLERLLVKGVKPVEGPPPPHQNRQVDSALTQITFRDDRDPQLGASIDELSIHTRPTTHFIDHWGGWFDAATADAVICRFANNPRPQRAVIGPWNHGATQQPGSPKPALPLLAQMQEALRTFDQPPGSRQLHYYTLFEERWKTTQEWPPSGFTPLRLYFQPDHGLAALQPLTQAGETFTVDFSASSGLNNRWQTELDQRPVGYTPQAHLLAYTSAPLERQFELTGYPIVNLTIRSTHTDGAFFVYLEAIDTHGQSFYLTEGMLRALHRKTSSNPPYKLFVPYHSFKRADAQPLVPGEIARLHFGLNPISARLQAGWRLRLAIACADKDTFQRIPAEGTPQIELLTGGDAASYIEISTNERNPF
jgi:hypothetical protein